LPDICSSIAYASRCWQSLETGSNGQTASTDGFLSESSRVERLGALDADKEARLPPLLKESSPVSSTRGWFSQRLEEWEETLTPTVRYSITVPPEAVKRGESDTTKHPHQSNQFQVPIYSFETNLPVAAAAATTATTASPEGFSAYTTDIGKQQWSFVLADRRHVIDGQISTIEVRTFTVKK
jgi:hypothetical protein